MTDAPRTTSLQPNEWQALCHGAAAQLAGLFAQSANLDDVAYAAAGEHIDRLAMFLESWRLTCAPHAGVVERHEARAPGHLHPQGETQAANGAAEPKRKGGWPKGKSRKPGVPVGEPATEAVG